MSCRAVVLIAVLALAGCAQKGVTVPKVVHVNDTRYMVPADLLAHCPIAMPTNQTIGEAVRIANARRVALEACNAVKDQYRGLDNGH